MQTRPFLRTASNRILALECPGNEANPLHCYGDEHFPYLAGVNVTSGSFNGTAPEDCEGGAVTEHLVHCDYFISFVHSI